jgi:hypothetical protein
MPASLGPRLRTAGGATRRRGGGNKLDSSQLSVVSSQFSVGRNGDAAEEPSLIVLSCQLSVLGGAKRRRGGGTKLDSSQLSVVSSRWGETETRRRNRAPSRIKKATMVEEPEAPEETKKLGLAAAIARGIARYTDLETRMAEFEEKLRRDPQSFSPLLR